jgi:hypothetical protein
MKCVCGYEYREGIIGAYPEEVWGLVMGDEEFLLLSYVRPLAGEHGGELFNVYACPKCGTIKLDVSEV